MNFFTRTLNYYFNKGLVIKMKIKIKIMIKKIKTLINNMNKNKISMKFNKVIKL